MKPYKITFVTKKNGYRNWRIDITADNAKAAREKVEEMWNNRYKLYGNIPHMFHINIKLLKPDEEFLYHWFTEMDNRRDI